MPNENAEFSAQAAMQPGGRAGPPATDRLRDATARLQRLEAIRTVFEEDYPPSKARGIKVEKKPKKGKPVEGSADDKAAEKEEIIAKAKEVVGYD